MSKYAIIQLTGRQLKISKGDKFTLDRLDQPEDKEFQVKEVLMIDDGKTQQIGTPFLDVRSCALTNATVQIAITIVKIAFFITLSFN